MDAQGSDMSDTVTPQRKLESKSGMGIFGWVIMLGMVVLLLPLVPLYLLLRVVSAALGNEQLRG